MRASESRIVEPNPFFRSQLLMKVAGFGVSLLIILTVGYLRWNGFQQQLVITVDANRSVQADIYVDSGLGMVSVPSLLNQTQSNHSPTQMMYPIQANQVKQIRFDPIVFTESEPFELYVRAIEIEVAPLVSSLSVSVGALRPLVGVHAEIDAGSLLVKVPAHCMDPQMKLVLPQGLRSKIEFLNRQSLSRLFFQMAGIYLVFIGVYLLMVNIVSSGRK